MEKDLILTLDAGSVGCKCTVFNLRGEALVSAVRNYTTEYPQPGWAEQAPERVVQAVVGAIKEILVQVSALRIACIGLSGTMNGCIATDAEGHALYPNIIHVDSRAEAQVEQLTNVIPAEAFYRLTGNRADCHYTLPKILWLKEKRPDVYRNTRWFLNIKDYVYAHMTGQIGYTDYSDASLTAALDISGRRWAGDMLLQLGLEPERMPRLLVSNDVRGKTTRDFYRATGIITGTPVAIGGGDGACTARGAGVDEPGSAYTYIGSSAWVSLVADSPMMDPKRRVLNYLDLDGEKYNVTGTVQCGYAAFNWALNNLLGGKDEPANVSAVENMARQIEPGSNGVLFLPTLASSRTPYWDPNTRGVLMGYTLYHDRRHIARSIYEGIAYALNGCAQVMKENGAHISSMMLTGAGARSGLWPDILASLYGMQTTVHRTPGETASLGAAIAAGVGVGIYKDYADASRLVKARSVHTVNPEWHRKYEEMYAIYADIYSSVKQLNDRIAAIRDGDRAHAAD